MFPAHFVAPCPVVHGVNRIDDLADHVAGLIDTPATVVILCDRGVAKAGLADRLRVATGRSDTLVIDTIAPTTDSIARTAQRLRAPGPVCIVGLGGGGALDAAKLIAATLASEHPLGACAAERSARQS